MIHHSNRRLSARNKHGILIKSAEDVIASGKGMLRGLSKKTGQQLHEEFRVEELEFERRKFGKQEKASVMTKDKEFKKFQKQVKIRWIG